MGTEGFDSCFVDTPHSIQKQGTLRRIESRFKVGILGNKIKDCFRVPRRFRVEI